MDQTQRHISTREPGNALRVNAAFIVLYGMLNLNYLESNPRLFR